MFYDNLNIDYFNDLIDVSISDKPPVNPEENMFIVRYSLKDAFYKKLSEDEQQENFKSLISSSLNRMAKEINKHNLIRTTDLPLTMNQPGVYQKIFNTKIPVRLTVAYTISLKHFPKDSGYKIILETVVEDDS